MISKQESWSILIAGHWNRMIFTPEWVGSRLFHQDEVETLIALLPIFPVIYRHSEVVLEASAGRLVFHPRFNTDSSLEAAQRMALTVLDDLPRTPLLGVGINFCFIERNPPAAMLQVFNHDDDRLIARAEWDNPETTVTRKLTGQHGTLNLSLGRKADGITIDFNFHTDTIGTIEQATAAARQAIDGRVVRLRDTALGFMRDIYHLQLEEGDEHG
ncbi:MAG: hypothetical protein ABSH35_32925 [Isosphaeraceae bacterium]|jgi:hypothetical protein